MHLSSFNFSSLLFLLSSRSRSDDSSGSSESGLQTRILSTFLNEMDGIGSKDFSEEGVIEIKSICKSSVK